MDERDALLAAAVEAYEPEAARRLVEDGADPDRVLPDGTTPLLRAVEGGSPAMVTALLGDACPRLPEAEQGRLIDAARRWYEEGAERRLRRLTGAAGPADTVRALDSEFERVAEITLGGRTVRAGHGAVLTLLEWEFGVLPPVEELVARAVRHRGEGEGEDHVDRAASLLVLIHRHSARTWAETTAFRHDPDPWRRGLAADAVRDRLWQLSWPFPADASRRDEEWEACTRILFEWEPEETDPHALARILQALRHTGTDLSAHEDIALRRAGHPAPEVRREVPGLFVRPLSPDALRAVRDLCRDVDAAVRAESAEVLAEQEPGEGDRELMAALLRDTDPEVVSRAVRAFARGADHSAGAAEALVRFLDADDPDVRLNAAYGLYLRDDPRTLEAYDRVAPLGRLPADDPRLEGRWRFTSRKGVGIPGSGAPATG
ncbi:HEAT repeat domain-containing protein [Streptomyces sp. NPDC090112]|uniref:HEAT repeat domain-containing protein n=1 Tax=Streptomyces sp. NPDC090112 TaxID=3365949 RepID=UPI0038170683